MSDSPEDDGLLEDQASRVLERATQIDARRGVEVHVTDLRNAALEAGIPLDAFERALAEVRTSSMAAQPQPLRVGSAVAAESESHVPSLSPSFRRALLATLGGGMAWLAFALSGIFGVDLNATIQFSLVLAFFATCGLVVARRADREVLKFEFDLAALWVGLTLVWMLFDPADAGAVLAQMGLIGGIAGLVGAVLVAKQPEHAPPLQLPALGTNSTTEDPAV